jgi:lipopolysaccharide biosynthesis protein
MQRLARSKMKKSRTPRIYYSPLDMSFYENEQRPLLSPPGVKLITFYFPQYHPFPENDQFWGKGFTEWTNVTKALPVFEGHYQPRLPGELGFYDVRIKDVMRRQIELLKQYGCYGFCFHHYWFSGRRVMRVPYDTIIADKSLDVPFCLHWANEPWTVRWDGCLQGGVLLAQKHDPADDLAFIKDIVPALRDERYIRVQGRPLLIIYRPRLFPNIKETVERWQEFCHWEGLGELYLAMMQTSFEGEMDPSAFGFDAAIEYPPHNLRLTNLASRTRTFDPAFKGGIYDYAEMAKQVADKPVPHYKLFRGIMPEWDCTPRRSNPDIFINCSPGRYQQLLERQIAYTAGNQVLDEKFIFVNAWNEWAEGANLEPDRKYGFAYLNATFRALHCTRKIAVKAHLTYEDLVPEVIQYLKNIPQAFDLYVTTSPRLRARLRKLLHQHFEPARVHVTGVVNRGRDASGFVCEFVNHYRKYDLVCVINDKKSLRYGKNLQFWRKYLYSNVMNSFESVQKVWSMFDADATLGVVYPEHYGPILDMVEWGSNFDKARKLFGRMGIAIAPATPLEYPSGFMFWFRPEALAPLFELGLRFEDFDEEAGQADGTLAHVIERSILFVAERAGYHGKAIRFYDGTDDLSQENFVLRYSLKNRPIALFGSGSFGNQVLTKLQKLNFEVRNILDNNPEKWGDTVGGVAVIPPDKMERGCYLLITSLYYEEIKKQLLRMGLVEFQDFLFLPKDQVIEKIEEYAGWQKEYKRDVACAASVGL